MTAKGEPKTLERSHDAFPPPQNGVPLAFIHATVDEQGAVNIAHGMATGLPVDAQKDIIRVLREACDNMEAAMEAEDGKSH